MRYIATVDDQTFTIAVPENGHQRTVTLGGRALDVDWQPVGDAPLAVGEAGMSRAGHYSLLIGARSFDVYIQPVADRKSVV